MTFILASPLTELPPTPPPPDLTSQNPVEVAGETTPKRIIKKPKDKKQIFDSVIELPKSHSFGQSREDTLGSQSQKDLSEILTKVCIIGLITKTRTTLICTCDSSAIFFTRFSNNDALAGNSLGPCFVFYAHQDQP